MKSSFLSLVENLFVGISLQHGIQLVYSNHEDSVIEGKKVLEDIFIKI